MKLRTLFENTLLGSMGLASILLLVSLVAGASRNIYSSVLSARLYDAKRVELRSLAEDVLKKAEFRDGKGGMSLEDMAEMSHQLRCDKIIYEGDNLFLNVDWYGGAKPPELSLKVVKSDGSYIDGIRIDEQIARDYAYSKNKGD